MNESVSRRDVLKQGASMVAVLAFFESPLFAQIWGASEGEEVVPFLDPFPSPPPEIIDALGDLQPLDWQNLDSWITAADRFFSVGHYGTPEVNADNWTLELGGLIQNPRRYTLDELKALSRKEVVFALECSGNGGFEWMQGAIGNARWRGTPLAPILENAGVRNNGVEVIFYGADSGEETIPYNDGLGNRLDEFRAKQNFARSMSLEDAMDPDNILCYEINGQPLRTGNGYPLRLIAPRWYGVANVKWLERIEVIDRRFMGLFMADRYVTVHEETRDNGEKVLRRSSVGKSLLKSMTAKVTVKDGQYRIYGAAWGKPVAKVEVRIDDGAWLPATLDEGQGHDFAWKFWHVDWNEAVTGDHTLTARAVAKDGNVQPAPNDPVIANKRTYWEANAQITRRIRIS